MRLRFQHLKRPFQVGRLEQVVGVDHAEIATRRMANTEIAGPWQAASYFVHDSSARPIEAGQEAARHRIGRPVVDHDNLEVLNGLSGQAVERLPEIRPQVVARDDKRGGGAGHGVAVNVST